MPRFDFACKKCAAVFEESLPFGSTKKPACPACGSRAVEKLITPPGIVFKGSGWYKTDSRSSAAGPKPKKEEKKKEPKKDAS